MASQRAAEEGEGQRLPRRPASAADPRHSPLRSAALQPPQQAPKAGSPTPLSRSGLHPACLLRSPWRRAAPVLLGRGRSCGGVWGAGSAKGSKTQTRVPPAPPAADAGPMWRRRRRPTIHRPRLPSPLAFLSGARLHSAPGLQTTSPRRAPPAPILTHRRPWRLAPMECPAAAWRVGGGPQGTPKAAQRLPTTPAWPPGRHRQPSPNRFPRRSVAEPAAGRPAHAHPRPVDRHTH